MRLFIKLHVDARLLAETCTAPQTWVADITCPAVITSGVGIPHKGFSLVVKQRVCFQQCFVITCGYEFHADGGPPL